MATVTVVITQTDGTVLGKFNVSDEQMTDVEIANDLQEMIELEYECEDA